MLILCKGVLFFLTLSLGVTEHSIFRNLHPCKSQVLMKSIARGGGGLPNLGQVLKIDKLTCNPSESTISCGKAECWGACNMCKATVQSHKFWHRSWWLALIFVCLFICVLFVFFFCLFVCLFIFISFLFFGPLVLAGRVLWNRVCPSFCPSILLSFCLSRIVSLVFSWNCIISFFKFLAWC